MSNISKYGLEVVRRVRQVDNSIDGQLIELIAGVSLGVLFEIAELKRESPENGPAAPVQQTKVLIQPCLNSACTCYNPDEENGSNCFAYHISEMEDICGAYKAEQ